MKRLNRKSIALSNHLQLSFHFSDESSLDFRYPRQNLIALPPRFQIKGIVASLDQKLEQGLIPFPSLDHPGPTVDAAGAET
jgi:hypothetical protein